MKKILILIVTIALYSCNHKATQVESTLKLDARKDTCVSLYDIFSSFDFIPLETNEKSLLKSPALELKVYNDIFYIFDDEQMLIMTFDIYGKHLSTIDLQGNGLGEYTELYDFSFNQFTGNLELLDPHLGINIYNKDNYKFIRRINKPTNFPIIHRFCPINPSEYLFLCESKDGNKMVIYNFEKNKITSELYDIPEFLLFKTFYHHVYSPFYVFADKVHFVQAYDGKVFILEKNKLSEKYYWDFGANNFNLQNLPPDNDIKFYFNWDKTIGKNYATCFVKYAENKKYYMTQYRFNGKKHHLIYNKEDKSTLTFTSFQEGNFSTPTFMDEKFAYSIIMPQLLEYYINPNLLDNKSKEIFGNIQDDDNPVILKYKLKK